MQAARTENIAMPPLAPPSIAWEQASSPVAVPAAKISRSANLEGATTEVVRGRANILALRPQLEDLARRFNQPSAVGQLEYFLTLPWALKKIPHVITVSAQKQRSEIPAFSLGASAMARMFSPSARDLAGRRALEADSSSIPSSGSLQGAVLVHEYAVGGIGTGVFSTDDTSGVRTVLGPEELRPRIAMLAAQALLRRQAQIVLISCRMKCENPLQLSDLPQLAAPGACWATQWRQVRDQFPLSGTYDDTLAMLGKHTRRNLRYYRRRAEKDLEVEFFADAQGKMSEAEFQDLNLNSTHPVAPEEASRRFRSMSILSDGVLCGIRRPSGEWLSVAGGWHLHDESWIEWQLNRAGLEEYSISTVMRSYLIETLVARETRNVSFIGGTPHSMSESFIPNWTVDVVLRRQSLAASLVRRLAKRLFRAENCLSQSLTDPNLLWTVAA